MIPRRRYSWPPGLAFAVQIAFARNEICAGPAIEDFEDAFRRYLIDRDPATANSADIHIRATHSGRSALAILLHVLEVPPGSTVMIPAYTLGAIEPFIRSLGFRVVACDVGDNRPVMTPSSVESAWTPGVACVLATHLFGYPADVPGILEVARIRKAVVIEDCAHTPGTYLAGRHVGLMGHGSFFSLDALKPVNTAGGGMAVVRSTHAGEKLSRLSLPPPRSRRQVIARLMSAIIEDTALAGPWNAIPTGLLAHPRTGSMMGWLDSRFRRSTGSNYPIQALSNLQAMIGLAQLGSVDARIERKRDIALRICATMGKTNSALLDQSNRCNAYFLVLKATDPESLPDLRWALWRHGIDAGIGNEVADYIASSGERPNARRWANSCIQVPCFPSMTDREITKVGQVLAEFAYDLNVW